MPRVEVAFDLLVVQNNHERNKPTNTGRLILESMPSARLSRYAVRGEAYDPTPLRDPDLDYLLLFPRDDARELGPDDLRPVDGRRRCVVLVDGTWGQCSRMSRRVPGLAEMPAYLLPPGPASHWGVRRASEPSRISTFEAMIRLVELSEGLDAAAPLHEFFDRLAAAMLFMKGKLRSPEVPEQWPIEGGVSKVDGL